MTNATIELIKASLAKGEQLPEDLRKAFTQSLGLVNYDLQPAALSLFPVNTPLRNRIPRVPANGGTATNWKAVTGINTTNMSLGVSEGNRSGVMTTTTADYTAAYRGLGLEDSVTFEADYAGQGFDDVKAIAVRNLLTSVMIGEERVIWGGNGSIELGITPTPSVTAADTGGSLTGAAVTGTTYSVQCVALTHEGYKRSSVAGGIPGALTRTNADGTTDTFGGGNAQVSAAATGAISADATAGKLTCTVTAVPGAAGYAWYWGAAGAEKLGAITTVNAIVIKTNATGTQEADTVAAADHSKNALVFDGLLSQIFKSGSGAYVKSLDGAALTSDGAGGIAEIETALASYWENYKLSPSDMYCSATELIAMNKLIIANGGAPLIRFNMDGSNPALISAGAVIGSYLNKITNTLLKIHVHPDAVPGLLMFFSDSVPYPLSGVSNVVQLKERKSYYQLEWPLVTRKYQFGVYVDELLQNYFPPAFGAIYNIA